MLCKINVQIYSCTLKNVIFTEIYSKTVVDDLQYIAVTFTVNSLQCSLIAISYSRQEIADTADIQYKSTLTLAELSCLGTPPEQNVFGWIQWTRIRWLKVTCD